MIVVTHGGPAPPVAPAADIAQASAATSQEVSMGDQATAPGGFVPRAGEYFRATRVLLADDHPEVRSALRLLLDHEPGLEVVGEADSIDSLLALTRDLKPDLLILDWEIPGAGRAARTGVRQPLLSSLRDASPDIRVLAMSSHPELAQPALRVGADGFAYKGDPPERLIDILGTLAQQQRVKP